MTMDATVLTVEGPGDSTFLVTDSNQLLASAQGLVITNDAQLKQANDWLRDAVTLKKKAADHMAKSKEMAYKLHAQLCADEKELQRVPLMIDAVLRPKILGYQKERRIKAERIAEEARKAAWRAEEDERLAKAAQLEAAGHPEIAEAVIDAPMPAPRPVSHYAPPPVKLEGTATKRTLDFRIINPDAVGRDYCDPSEKRIRELVRALGMKAVQLVGGIEVFEVESLAVKAWK